MTPFCDTCVNSLSDKYVRNYCNLAIILVQFIVEDEATCF